MSEFEKALLSALIAVVVASAMAIPIYIFVFRGRKSQKSRANKMKIQLPKTREEIMERLSRANDFDYYEEKLYPQIAAHAGETFNAPGLVFMLLMEIAEYESNFNPELPKLTLWSMNKWIDALIDDKKIAEVAKGIYLEYKQKTEDLINANIPAVVKPTGPAEDDELFSAVMRIKDIFFEEVARGDPEHLIHVEQTEDGVNPYYSQTEKGLYLEYYYGHPSRIWTPWGEYRMVCNCSYSGNAPWEGVLNNFLERLGATLHTPETNEKWGTYGPVYAIHKVEELQLPDPVIREKQNFREYEEVNIAWKNMEDRFLEKKSVSKNKE